jgi:hypothetical protein
MEGETLTMKNPVLTMASVLCILCYLQSENTCLSQQPKTPLVRNQAVGIAFSDTGKVEMTDSTTYRIVLPSSGLSPAPPAFAQISVSDRLFVDLPGTYGGRLYLDAPGAARALSSRVLVDSVKTESQTFRREYWIVYAGMGMWEGVINCTTEENGRYYIVSLIQEKPLGKPGEEVEGRPLLAGDLAGRFLRSLRDTSNAPVKEFGRLLGSVQIQHQP